MASPRYLGGYPVSVTNLVKNDFLFFNGKAWVNVQKAVQFPETFPLDQPSFFEEQIVVFDGLPVLMANLAPGDIMAVIAYDITPVSEGVVAESFVQMVYTNISRSLVYKDTYIKPEMTKQIDTTPAKTYMSGAPGNSFEITIE